jgi:hypothetical protein
MLTLTDPTRTGAATYAFSCPTCDDLVVRRADADVVALLTSNGVTVVGPLDRSMPGHPEDPPDGPPFVTDDLRLLRALLADDLALHRTLEAVRETYLD